MSKLKLSFITSLILSATVVFAEGLKTPTSLLIYEDPEVICLAMNIYHEARGSSFVDQAAVADVTLNRVESTKFPNTVCEVVYQAELSQWHLEQDRIVPLKNRCQFSWYCDGRSDEATDKDAFVRAQYLAYNVIYHDQYRGITEGATHYHAHYVTPQWASMFRFVSRIGDHYYYASTKH